MEIIGKANKTFGELEHGEHIHYINHLTLKIETLTVYKVLRSQFKGHVEVQYFKSSQLITMVEDQSMIPLGKIICPANASSILTKTNPPNIYCTSKSLLESWMRRK